VFQSVDPLGERDVEAARHFANKIWNAARLVLSSYEGGAPELPEEPERTPVERWLLSRHEACRAQVDAAMDEYRFSLDRSPPRGRVVFRAHNRGRLEHELVLVEVPPELERSVDEQLRSPERLAVATRAYIRPRPPGASGVFAVELGPGRYAFICFVEDADGEIHGVKGMNAEFRVG
jgi:hypothetical protein